MGKQLTDLAPAWSAGLLLAVLLVMAAVSREPLATWLVYNRVAILDGEWWRVLTGHWVHIDVTHLLLNFAGLLLCTWLYRDVLQLKWLAGVLAACSLAVSVSLLWFNTNVQWYAGLSGVLHGLLAFAATSLLAVRDVRALLLPLLAVKLIIEQMGIALPWSGAMNYPVIVDAHLYGVVSGLLAGVWYGMRHIPATAPSEHP